MGENRWRAGPAWGPAATGATAARGYFLSFGMTCLPNISIDDMTRS